MGIMAYTDKIIFNENDFVTIDSVIGKNKDHITIGEFFDELEEDDYVFYDKDTKEYSILMDGVKYSVCFSDELKKMIKNNESNIIYILHNRYLKDETRIIVDNVEKTGYLPASIEKLKLFKKHLEEQYKETKASVAVGGVISAGSLIITIASAIATVYFFNKGISSVVWTTLLSMLSLGGAVVTLSSFSVLISYVNEYNKIKDYLDKVKKHLETKSIRFDENTKTYKDNILETISELSLSLDNVIPEKKGEYTKLINELLNDYRKDVNKLLSNRHGASLHFNQNYQAILEKYSKRMGELQFMIDSDSPVDVSPESFNKECQTLEESINQGRLLGGH